MKNIGLFGGSFNPIHQEHVKIALHGVKELKLDKLFIIPTYIAPHKQGEEVISGEHRLNMIKLAFEGNNNIEPCDYEIKSGGVSYSYLTITYFKKLYPSSKLYFFMGSDMLENFPTWKNPEFITQNAQIVLIERKGENLKNETLIKNIKKLYSHDVILLSVYGEEVSSTEIRIRKMLNLSLDGLVLKEVEDYIDKNNLYSENKYYTYVKNALPVKRRLHTLGVILTALKLAKKLNVDKKKVEISALLHDCAKYVEVDDLEKYDIPKNCPKEVMHQYVGAYVAEKILNVKDAEILSAIKFHTSGRKEMTLLEKIIYTADIIEPSRKFLGVEELRLAVEKDFESGFLICIAEILEFLKKQGGEIYPLSIEACEYYKNKQMEN